MILYIGRQQEPIGLVRSFQEIALNHPSIWSEWFMKPGIRVIILQPSTQGSEFFLEDAAQCFTDEFVVLGLLPDELSFGAATLQKWGVQALWRRDGLRTGRYSFILE
jgi:hypothetical protein